MFPLQEHFPVSWARAVPPAASLLVSKNVDGDGGGIRTREAAQVGSPLQGNFLWPLGYPAVALKGKAELDFWW